MKPYTKILVPTDFSAHAGEALNTAIDLSSRYGASLALVHVFDRFAYPFPDSSAIATTLQIAKAEDEINSSLDEQRRLASDQGAQHVTTTMLRGEPAGQIADFAKHSGVDLIVMGTHGRRGVSRFLMGSVAERVIRIAPCSVLTVRMPVR